MRRTHGFTLVELLAAAAILGVLLVLASSMTVQAARAGASVDETAQREQLEALTRELLREQLQLAAFGPAAGDVWESKLQLGIHVGGAGAGGDVLEVSYLEDRWSRTPQRETVRLEARRDSNRNWNLYLRQEGATRQPAVQEVSGLRVISFATPAGSVPSTAPLPLQATGLELEVSFTWQESSNLFIPFGAPVTVRSLP